jgi:hypothetical protein
MFTVGMANFMFAAARLLAHVVDSFSIGNSGIGEIMNLHGQVHIFLGVRGRTIPRILQVQCPGDILLTIQNGLEAISKVNQQLGIDWLT